MEAIILTLGWIGLFAPVALGVIGSVVGCTRAGQAAIGALLDTERGHGRYIGISAMPSSQTIFGIVVMLTLNRPLTIANAPGTGIADDKALYSYMPDIIEFYTGEKALLPNVPTLAEAGVKDADVYSWQGIAAPKGLPADVKAKLHAAIVAALNDPAVKPKLLEVGFEIVANTPAQFAAFQAAESARWKHLIETRKITAD